MIQPTEDTRTLFRLTALKRLPALDLQSPKVQQTINMMVERKIAIDPTLGVHEQLLQKVISMVVKDGTVYYPSEAYPKFGIQPFAAAPKIVGVTAAPP